MDNYDEFGNYIGPDLSDSESDVSSQLDAGAAPEETPAPPIESVEDMAVDEPSTSAVILHEDKQIYKSARDVYGDDVEVRVEDEDTQGIEEPIMAPVVEKKIQIAADDGPRRIYDSDFLASLLEYPEFTRNVCAVGAIHSGKTALVDCLVYETHHMQIDADAPLRYTDITKQETERGVSLRSCPMTFAVPVNSGKHHVLNIFDTPGHTDFVDEMAAGLAASDGAILIVDALDGVVLATRTMIKELVSQQKPFVLMINKIDRLILELRLPPMDTYLKLKSIVEQVNACAAELDPTVRLSPERNNVIFASLKHGYLFTLKSFAELYTTMYGNALDTAQFAKRLWGNWFYNAQTRAFSKTNPVEDSNTRTFIHFILLPLYKLYTHTLGTEGAELKTTLGDLGIYLKKHYFSLDVKVLLRIIMNRFFGPCRTTLMQVLVDVLPAPVVPDVAAPLVAQAVKLYPTVDGSQLRALVRVHKGEIAKGMRLKVLGPHYGVDDEDDLTIEQVSGVYLAQARYVMPVNSIPQGQWALVEGIDATIVGPTTLASVDDESPAMLPFGAPPSKATMKIAVEPLVPSELPKLVSGLRYVSQMYPLLEMRVEESGQHVLVAPGELYLDTVMNDLRTTTEIEIKVSDPIVRLAETVLEETALFTYAFTANGRNKLSVICEPLEPSLTTALETRAPVASEISPFFRSYDWDLISSRSVWAFGPATDNASNVLRDDTIPGEIDRSLLYSVRNSASQGFQWACREGPLCDEPVRGGLFRILDASLATEPIHRGAGQIIPTARRVCYASMLLAKPRLQEPVYLAEILAPPMAVQIVYTLLARRRGHVLHQANNVGTPLVLIEANIPVLDAFGFEVDLRTHTLGQAFVQMIFDRWAVVPGDPLDKSIQLRPLQPAPPQHLARDLLLKTRRQKGLGDVNVVRYLESDLVAAVEEMDYGLVE